ncbi:MAG: TolC family protein [Acidobacteriia bacterium]|nr:TolC family protein [Terriglobia bacterium]
MRIAVRVLPLVFALGPAFAQMTIEQAVQDAATKYPAVRASLEQVSAAAAAINLARTAWLPKADFDAQLNRATHNNIFGLLLPSGGAIPGISGPVLGTNSLASVWGSAAGVMVEWEPFDFGLRKANVAIAEAGRNRAGAQVAVTRLEAAAAAAEGFLTLLAAQQTVTAAEAGVERARVLNEVVGALVKSELRPGAEGSRTRAELALAETRLSQAQQAVEVARAALGQVLGVPPAQISVLAGKLLDLPAESAALPEQAPAAHPAALAQKEAVAEVQAREKALDRSWYPHFNLESAAFARGTGIQADGATGGAASGLGPNIQNWAIGLNVTFPAFDLPSIKAKKEIEHYRERAEQARYEQVLQDLNGGLARARAVLDGARRVARNTPIQWEAARDTERQATARYRSGLGNIVEVAEAQRLATQAEIDDALARLSVWHALLGLAVAQGDLAGFVQLTR